jgi:hypothetical protein
MRVGALLLTHLYGFFFLSFLPDAPHSCSLAGQDGVYMEPDWLDELVLGYWENDELDDELKETYGRFSHFTLHGRC